MVKDLDYYLSLPYKICVEDDSDGFILSMPELGRAAVNGYGTTYEEAKKCLREVQKDVLTIMLEDGVEIPEPERAISDEVRFVVFPAQKALGASATD